ITESIRNIPSTAHILGGAVVGADAESGVVDAGNRVFGYENLLVCDGAAIPANPGVNPSLTITAKAEHAMSLIPPKGGAEPRDLLRRWGPSSAGLGETLGDVVPVDDVPESVDVVGALVLVLEVVGVLPDVAAEQRHAAVGDRRVLVRRGDDGEAGGVFDQP